jgi:hypothetical protein
MTTLLQDFGPDADADARASFAGVLGAVSSEAALARARFEQLQGTMGELIAFCPPERRAAAMADVQLVDALAQHLEALSTFAGELARHSGACGSLQVKSALDAVTLAEVRGRLVRLCEQPGDPHVEPDGDPGDLDLF